METAGGPDVAIPSVPINYPDSQFLEPDLVTNTEETAVPAATATQKKSTKKGKDAKWTDKMKDKLAAVVYMNKALHQN
jgi:phage-related tail fiber protein